MRREIDCKGIWQLLLGIAVAGCQSAAELQPAAVPEPSPAASSADALGNKSPVIAADGQQSQADRPPAVAQFSPPFPDRLELFEPPKRAASAMRQNDNEGSAVELKGFITVDRPRAVLSIDGVIAPIPEGGEKYGVQVLSIQPPSVVLQRGRTRWTATLE